MKEERLFICECHSWTHQCIFYWDEEEKRLYITVHLTTHRNFFKRLWVGLRFAFGFTSNYGQWDEFILKPQDKKRLQEYLNQECIE